MRLFLLISCMLISFLSVAQEGLVKVRQHAYVIPAYHQPSETTGLNFGGGYEATYNLMPRIGQDEGRLFVGLGGQYLNVNPTTGRRIDDLRGYLTVQAAFGSDYRWSIGGRAYYYQGGRFDVNVNGLPDFFDATASRDFPINPHTAVRLQLSAGNAFTDRNRVAFMASIGIVDDLFYR